MKTICFGVLTYNRQDLLPGLVAGVVPSAVQHCMVINNGAPARMTEFAAANPAWEIVNLDNTGCCGGFNEMFRRLADYDVVILCCDDITFPPGEFAKFVTQIQAAGPAQILLGFEYACASFPREAVALIGTFDENYWPGTHADWDYSRRAFLLGVPPKVADVNFVHLQSQTFNTLPTGAHAEMLNASHAYHEQKWGDGFQTPFGAGGPVSAWTLASDLKRRLAGHFVGTAPAKGT